MARSPAKPVSDIKPGDYVYWRERNCLGIVFHRFDLIRDDGPRWPDKYPQAYVLWSDETLTHLHVDFLEVVQRR